jgi:lipoate-protein ligase A
VSLTCFVINSGACQPPFNMALDEALLEAMPRIQAPVLRFYGWTDPAASFGYFQKYREIEKLTSLRPLIRRPTGGGLVPHNADWTYSLSIPTTAEWYLLSAIESYKRIHEWICASLTALGTEARLAPDCNASGPGQCFAGHERFDVLSRGRKIAGAAQRRAKFGLLIQGSLQPPPPGISRNDWQNAMIDASASPGFSGRPWEPDAQLSDRANALVDEKYSRSEYNAKR